MAITEASLDRVGRGGHDAAKRHLREAAAQLNHAIHAGSEPAAAQYVRNAAEQYAEAALCFKALSDILIKFAGEHE